MGFTALRAFEKSLTEHLSGFSPQGRSTLLQHVDDWSFVTGKQTFENNTKVLLKQLTEQGSHGQTLQIHLGQVITSDGKSLSLRRTAVI